MEISAVPETDCRAVEGIDDEQAVVGAARRRQFAHIAEVDRQGLWHRDHCRDMAQWLANRLGISSWTAHRWVKAAHAIEKLPATSAAMTSGELSVQKVVELTRLATPDTEIKLIKWAKRVRPKTIRARADLANRPSLEDNEQIHRQRFLDYYFDDWGMFRLDGALPPETGAKVARAIDRIADRIFGERGRSSGDSIDACKADALVELSSTYIANDRDADRATVVVHVPLAALTGDELGIEIEDGPIIHPEVARRISCDGRLQYVIESPEAHAVSIGRASRIVPRWMMRQLKYRDRGCTFPNCGTTRFLHAHHIVWWWEGGPTELDNLTLLCPYHHRLVHEKRWTVKLPWGITEWRRPDGRLYKPGRAPPAITAA